MGGSGAEAREGETRRRTRAAIDRVGRGARALGDLVDPGRRTMLRLRVADAADRFADAVRRDLDDGLALPGLVVVFACGIAIYFVLPREPWLPATVAVALVAVTVTAWRRRQGHAARLAAVIAALAVGIATAGAASRRVAAPRLDHERTVTVEGRVVDVDATARGGLRMTVDVVRMEGRGLVPGATPTRIGATVTSRGSRPEVGSAVRFRARLKPPEGPVLPGGYDFARRAWFDGRGAAGYVLGRVEPIDLGPPAGFTRLFAPIGVLRHRIAERVRAGLPGPTGTIAAALMVGEQRAIPDEVAEPLRASGLTHIVSISGLHMSLVAGGVIVAIRALLALFPALALGRPIRKWAAAAALLAATVYLLLSGNQVAALRSHLMLAVALVAVMVDRPAVTMHTVAVSAVAILAFDPSQALEPSFLMSYLAVIGLVSAYDLHRRLAALRPPPRREAGYLAHAIGAGLRHIEGLALSSLVAGLATAPVIAGVFFRGAPYSILANMAVLPVTGLVIMPAAVIAALAMPFGLDPLPLWAMGLGIDWMIAVGRWTAALPGGAGLIGAPHPAATTFGIAAVLWLSVWRSRIRLLGLGPAAAAVLLLFAGPRADVMVGRHGTPVAVRDASGRLQVLAGRADRFDTAIWLAADADARLPTDPALAKGWTCDPLGCLFRLPVGASSAAGAGPANQERPASPASAAGLPAPAGDAAHGIPAGGSGEPQHGRRDTSTAPPAIADPDDDLVIAVVRHPDAFEEDCRRAAVVVTALVAPPGCRDVATVIDRIDLARGGATMLAFAGPVVRGPLGTPTGAAAGADADRARSGRVRDAPPVDPTRDDAAFDPASAVSDGEVAQSDASDVVDGPAGPSDDSTDAGPPGAPRAAFEPEESWPRRSVAIVRSLPTPPRPWTPIDSEAERLAEEARSLDAAVPPGAPRRVPAAHVDTPFVDAASHEAAEPVVDDDFAAPGRRGAVLRARPIGDGAGQLTGDDRREAAPRPGGHLPPAPIVPIPLEPRRSPGEDPVRPDPRPSRARSPVNNDE